ncbi:bola-like protein [Exidia glandulosa HHB12029]|uniref:Bola-like protein n=1 Tax=Exidia glandulosa HHB12029 TaxID=1314781 RepID=A0A165QPN8_EXIGL|nr:bola-like protein [Exidia glandulosa HHB12029]
MQSLARTRTLLARAVTLRFNSSAAAPQLDGERAIEQKLRTRFSPSNVQVQDVSGGCGTFYAISITSSAFKDLSIVQQHRLVNETLKEDIKDIHGLQLKTTAE